jgi:DNA-binding transcriptional MocR family regulator
MYVIQWSKEVAQMWELKIIDTDKPLYIAIAEAIERDIKAGVLLSGEKLPTHRELARIVGVNVTTATRAYNEAEKRGLITSIVGNGTFVTSDMGANPSLMSTERKGKELIELGLVLPLYSVEPDITPVCKRVLSRKNINSFMQYTPPQGLNTHRRTGANWVSQYGVHAEESDIIVTSGAQHAINCVLSACFESGDRIAVDYLTYPGIKSAAKRCGIKLEGVMLDNEGMIPSELDALCKRHTIKGVYTTACLQNPTNAIMSDKRRNELADIIQKENLLLIEDDLYHFLCDNAGALSSLIPERSIYIAGIAKAFYAGLRIGFVVSPPLYYNKICQAVVDTVWMAPAINAEIACDCINSGLAAEIIRLKRNEISKRASLMAETLKDYEYKYAPDSMFAWLKLPDEWNSIQFEKAARENGVNVIASDKFTVSNITLPNFVRISLSGAESTSEFEKGLQVLLWTLQHGRDKVIGVM